MNDSTFQGNGKITYVPVVVNAKPPKPLTNYDRLRAMSVEEMAEFLTLIMMGEERSVPFIYSTVDKWLDWLKREVASDGNT